MSKLSDALVARRFVVTGEIGPPKGVDVREVLEGADLIRDRVVAANATDQQSAVMRLGSLATCLLLRGRGVEPIMQVTCRDRNRIALQSDLLSAAVLGIENVLCLTGDSVARGDHIDAKPVFDLDSVSLLAAASRLCQGRDLADKELKGSPRLFLGAIVTPGADPLEPQIIKMEKKIKAGARFFQTQAVFDIEAFRRFMKDVEYLHVPVIAGIILLKSAGMARFMNRSVAGVNVPESLIEEMSQAEDRQWRSIEIAARLIKELKGLCQGVHIMALGWERLVPPVLDAAGL